MKERAGKRQEGNPLRAIRLFMMRADRARAASDGGRGRERERERGRGEEFPREVRTPRRFVGQSVTNRPRDVGMGAGDYVSDDLCLKIKISSLLNVID